MIGNGVDRTVVVVTALAITVVVAVGAVKVVVVAGIGYFERQ